MATVQARRPAKRVRKTMPTVRPPSGERYSARRLGQFLLENATDAADYAAARREVRKLGLDPDRIPHDRP